MVGQPWGPLSRALPGRTRTGLTAICGAGGAGELEFAVVGVVGVVGGTTGGVVGVGVLVYQHLTHSWTATLRSTLPSARLIFASVAAGELVVGSTLSSGVYRQVMSVSV